MKASEWASRLQNIFDEMKTDGFEFAVCCDRHGYIDHVDNVNYDDCNNEVNW